MKKIFITMVFGCMVLFALMTTWSCQSNASGPSFASAISTITNASPTATPTFTNTFTPTYTPTPTFTCDIALTPMCSNQ